MGKSKKYGMNTKALHANKRFEPISGDVMPPLHLSTTYICLLYTSDAADE